MLLLDHTSIGRQSKNLRKEIKLGTVLLEHSQFPPSRHTPSVLTVCHGEAPHFVQLYAHAFISVKVRLKV